MKRMTFILAALIMCGVYGSGSSSSGGSAASGAGGVRHEVQPKVIPVGKIIEEIQDQLFQRNVRAILMQLNSATYNLMKSGVQDSNLAKDLKVFYKGLFQERLQTSVRIFSTSNKKWYKDKLVNIIDHQDFQTSLYKLAGLMFEYAFEIKDDDLLNQPISLPSFGEALDEELAKAAVYQAWGVLGDTKIDAHDFGVEYLSKAINLMFLNVLDDEKTEGLEYKSFTVKELKDLLRMNTKNGLIRYIGNIIQQDGKNIIEQIAEKLKNKATAQKLKQDLDQVVKDWNKAQPANVALSSHTRLPIELAQEIVQC